MADGFEVQPEVLAGAAPVYSGDGDRLARLRTQVSLLPGPTAFGGLPESAAVAAALSRCVGRSTDRLGQAADEAGKVAAGLAECAKKYQETDDEVSRRYRGGRH
jgi:hypothetical protein